MPGIVAGIIFLCCEYIRFLPVIHRIALANILTEVFDSFNHLK